MPLEIVLIVRDPGTLQFNSEALDATFSKYHSLALTSFSLGAANPGTASVPGHLAFDQLIITKSGSINSPLWLAVAEAGLTIPRLTLVLGITNPLSSSLIIPEIYSFGTVVMQHYTNNTSVAGGNAATETISFGFSQFAHHYYPVNQSGTATGPEVTASWDVAANTPWSGYLPLDGPVTK